MSYLITRFVKYSGPLTKSISLTAEGRIHSDGSACVMPEGEARRIEMAGVDELAAVITAMQPHEALALGSLRDDLPDKVRVTSRYKLAQMNGTAARDLIARTAANIVYRPKRAALALLDLDTKAMPPSVAALFAERGDYWTALVSVLPALKGVAHVVRSSTSAGLYREDTGEKLPGSDGVHIYVLVKDGADVERFLTVFHQRCWLAGLGWMMVGAGGQLLDRSIVDRMVGTPERLVFEGAPILDPPLAQDATLRRAIAQSGDALNTEAACPALSILDRSKLEELRAKEAQRLAPLAATVRADYIAERGRELSAKTGMSEERARKIITRRADKILLPEDRLPFDDPALEGVTVGQVLGDPGRYVDATLADPAEGNGYGTGVAIVMREADGFPWIHSFAHGRTIYRLRYDAAAIEEIIAKTGDDVVTEKFVELAARSDMNAGEYERIRDQVAGRARTGKRTIDKMLKQEEARIASRYHVDARQTRLAERKDTRPQVPVPPADAPWIPQMDILNQALGTSEADEPPTRDLEGYMVQVQTRRVLGLHTLTSTGTNDEDTNDTRLPAPEASLITRLDEAALAELIERHIDYVDDEGRAVHLPGAFVKHFVMRSDEALPLMTGVATLPIVLPNGEILTGRGLDRDRGILFRIPNELLKMLPKREDCTKLKVAEGMRFLIEEWLCDVAADHEGKCVLIAGTASIVERHALPARPGFVIKAGQRGTGKTTTVNMIAMAATGRSAAAAAWSPSDEERRKALLAYLAEGLPLLVWDNIPRGSAISCASIEKALTAETYSDRVLGLSTSKTVPASTIQVFTGNNIAARGDLSSRTLNVQLTVEQVDPENRAFKHLDPIGWTEAHRGKILAAIYTILLGNPRLTAEKPEGAETRFKMWWHLIGSAIENGWKEYVRGNGETSPMIEFKKMFIEAEEEEEQTDALAELIEFFIEKWAAKSNLLGNLAQFKAGDLADVLRPAKPDQPPNLEGQRWMGAMEQAAGKKMNGTSPQAINSTLKALTGAPVRIEKRVVMLEREKGRTATFVVKVINAPGS